MNKILNYIFTARNSKRFSVDARDIINSVYYFVGTSVAAAVMPNIENMTLPTLAQIKVAVGAGLVVAFQHIMRKYLTEVKVNVEGSNDGAKK